MAGIGAANRLLDEEELMRRLLAHYTLKECAAIFSVTYHTVCKRARRPDFLQKLRDLSSSIHSDVDNELRAITGLMTERIVELSSTALDKLERIMNAEGTDDRLVVKVAQDLLDRNNESSKTRKVEVKDVHKFMDPRVLADAARAAAEMELIDGGR